MEGKEIGDFFIKRNIGEGSLGPVYLAEHRFIKKLFALKCIPKELTNGDAFKENFAQEIANIAKLQHENIAAIHNVSFFEENLFIVSDYVRYKFPTSMNLGSYLATFPERLKEDEILQILKEVAFSLDYIHGQKILTEPMFHGGLKLSNILLSETKDGGYTVKLSDTGIMPMLGSSYVLKNMMKLFMAAKESSVQEKGCIKSFMQTYAFLAPEQRFASSNKMTYKCDSYAFGVLAYFLLMGTLPEGLLVMPSTAYKNSKVDWDMVIRATLVADPKERVDNLTTLINSAQSMTMLEKINIPTPKKQKEIKKQNKEEKVMEDVFAVAETPLEAQEKAFQKLKAKNRDLAYQNEITGGFAPKKDSSPSRKEHYAAMGLQEESMQACATQEMPGEVETKEISAKKLESSIEALEKNLIGSISPTARVRTMKKKTLEKITAEKGLKEPEDPSLIFKRDTEVRNYTPAIIDTASIKPLLTDTVEIAAGEYQRGSTIGGRDEKPCHSVSLDSFEIDIHPITNEQFLRFLMIMDGKKDSFNHDLILLKESRIKKQAGEFNIETGYSKHPVVGVSYYGAKAYADWIGKKLPTEAQWEIAASLGNSKNIYPTGENIERTQANFFSSDTIPVMSYPSTSNGLYDMAGNVYEWCEDWYDYNFYETSKLEPKNPKGPKQGVYRVLRGGCWKSLIDDLRCSHRFRNNPATMNRTYGFRCVSNK